ncbi:SMI1/KNR4 family protein [Streptomyces wuyuanensis]|uniref:SMI1/KNR4 family protein n=1 Tax=Streptomyces wuyuanensis TaxID=1196353 RepID=UPI0037199F4F
MIWVDRLMIAVDERPLGLAVDWPEIESRTGGALPADYREFCECFGMGEFCDYLTVYATRGGADSELADSQEANRRLVERHPVVMNGYRPYGLHRPGRSAGILQWGASSQGDEFAWLADESKEPDAWPVLAREDAGGWRRYDMSMSEFVYHLLVDESFEGFGGFGATGQAPYFTISP